MHSVDLRIDVTEAAGLGEPAWIAVTVHLPDPARPGDHRSSRQGAALRKKTTTRSCQHIDLSPAYC